MGLFKNAMRKGIPGRDSVGGMGSAMARPAPPRPTLVQGGPAYFTPEGYRPPMQPEQAFMPTDTMGDPIGDMFRRQLPPVRNQLPRMPPPRDPRDDFISIGGVGGNDGINDPRMQPMPEPPADPRDYMPRDPAAGMIPTPAPQGKMPSQATLDALEELRNNPGPGIPIGFGSYGPGGNLEMPDNGLRNYLPNLPVPAPMAPPLPNLGGTPIANDGTLGDFVLPPGYKEPVDSNDSERFNPIPGLTPIRQDLLPPKRNDFMSIDRVGDERTPFENQLRPQRRDEIAPMAPPQQPAPISLPQDMMDLPVSNNQTPLTQPIANPRNPEMFAEIQKRINDLGATSLNQDLAPIQQMPMMPELPRMPMPAPIATPMPMSPIDLPRLDLQELDSMDRQMSISRDFMPSRNLSLANKPMLMPLESRMPMMPRRRGR